MYYFHENGELNLQFGLLVIYMGKKNLTEQFSFMTINIPLSLDFDFGFEQTIVQGPLLCTLAGGTETRTGCLATFFSTRDYFDKVK